MSIVFIPHVTHCRLFLFSKTHLRKIVLVWKVLRDPKTRSSDPVDISEFPRLVCSFLNSIWTSPTPGTTAPGEGGLRPRGRGRGHPPLVGFTFRLNRSSPNERMGVLLKGHPASKGPKPPKGPKAPIYQKFVDLEFFNQQKHGVVDPQMGLSWCHAGYIFLGGEKPTGCPPVDSSCTSGCP